MAMKHMNIKVPYHENTVNVNFSVASNTCKIAEGDELVLFLPSCSKPRSQTAPSHTLRLETPLPCADVEQPKKKAKQA